MIRIERHRSDEHGVPIRPNDKWFGRAKDAKDLAVAEGAAHQVDASVYADLEVRLALEKLFYDKCAYCEGDASGQSDWDVEHFRPKGAVAERDDHAGYFWLAYDWENLYPACQHCNQKRKDRARWGDLSKAAGPAKGKLDQFPLADEANRAMDPAADWTLEATLLLDPCRDDPENHLRFGVQGQALAVAESPKAKASIEVFHLERKRLRDQRKNRILLTTGFLQLARNLEELLGPGHADVQRARQLLHDTNLADSVPFAAAGRWVLRDPASFGL